LLEKQGELIGHVYASRKAPEGLRRRIDLPSIGSCNPEMETVTMRLREVVWAAKEYRHETGYVTSFDKALTDPLWQIARDDPSSLSVTDVELWLVGFLNAWRCRLDYSIGASLRSAVVEVHPLCQRLIREGNLRKDIVARVFDTVCRARNDRREVGTPDPSIVI